MQLIGYMDSPFVRRVAVTARFLGIEYVHREISIFRDFDRFRAVNPLVKVPTWICDDGQVLVDSTLIIDYLERLAGQGRLMPSDDANYIRALGIIGAGMVANEKTVQLIYEQKQRPASYQYPQWIERVQLQLTSAAELLEKEAGDGSDWLFGGKITQADITTAIAWSFTRLSFPEALPAENYPGLAAFSARAEALPEFMACAVA